MRASPGLAVRNDTWPAVACAGVLEQVLDCSGGEDITEESGRQRKLDALLQLLRVQVRHLNSWHRSEHL